MSGDTGCCVSRMGHWMFDEQWDVSAAHDDSFKAVLVFLKYVTYLYTTDAQQQ